MDGRSATSEPQESEYEDDVRIKSLHVEDGKVEIQTDAPPEIITWFYASFKELLDKHNAPNFVQMEVKPADEVTRYMVTVQKVGGETPVEKANKMRAVLEEIIAIRQDAHGSDAEELDAISEALGKWSS